jgi:hypothetical protein
MPEIAESLDPKAQKVLKVFAATPEIVEALARGAGLEIMEVRAILGKLASEER